MSKPFDAATRHLLELDPRAWPAYIGVKINAPVQLVNSDLSTVTADADKILRVEDASPWLVHLELQSSYDADLPLRLARYNVLLEYRHQLPVLSAAVLPAAGSGQRKLDRSFAAPLAGWVNLLGFSLPHYANMAATGGGFAARRGRDAAVDTVSERRQRTIAGYYPANGRAAGKRGFGQ